MGSEGSGLQGASSASQPGSQLDVLETDIIIIIIITTASLPILRDGNIPRTGT